MFYKVIRPFKDLTDTEQHDYAEGDIFPRDGYEPSEDFVRGLLTGSNMAGSIFLTLVAEEPELPEGDKVIAEEPELSEGGKVAAEEPELPEGDNVTAEEVPVEKPKSKRKTKKAEV